LSGTTRRGTPPKNRNNPDMGLDPVRKLSASRSPRRRCNSRRQARRRRSPRRAQPRFAINDHDLLAGVIDKDLVAGRMVLPHGRRTAAARIPGTDRRSDCSHNLPDGRPVLLPQHHQIDARPLQLTGQRGPSGSARRRKPRLTPAWANSVVQERRRSDHPPKATPAGSRGTLEIVLDRAARHPSVRPISRALTPSRGKRSICRICRMVSSLLAGIRFPS